MRYRRNAEENESEFEDISNEEEENEEDESEQNNSNNKSLNEEEDEKSNSNSDSDSNSEADILNNLTQLEIQEQNEEKLKNYNPTNEEKQKFTEVLKSMKSNIEDISSKLENVVKNFNDNITTTKSVTDKLTKTEMKYGLSYLDSKNNLLLTYLTNLVFYSLLKLTPGKSIDKHPLIKKLIIIKTILERSKVIDLKLKSQIDRLLKLAEKDIDENTLGSTNNTTENDYRPRILDNLDVDDEEDEVLEKEENKKLKYQAKRNITEFFETTTDNKKRKKQILKTKEKIKNSETYKELHQQFSDAPLEINPYTSQLDKTMKEVEKYEEDNFIRVQMPKRQIKMLKKIDRKNDDLTNFGNDFKGFESVLNYEKKQEVDNETKFVGRKRQVNKSLASGFNHRGRGKKFYKK